jgi:tRNA 2-thiocytidine biosynthesis protein TtcA
MGGRAMSLVADKKPTLEQNKLHKRLRRQVGQAIADYRMIEEGDRVMVCLSGGKDSYTMLDILRQLQAKAPVRFELHAVHLDQKQPDYDATILPRYLESIGMPFTVLEQDTYSVVKRVVPEGKTMCGLCSRLRRGSLYSFAEREGFTRIALGHHRDDIVETMFLNLFYHSKLSAMPPKLKSDDGKHILIRPLAYCAEDDVAAYAAWQGYPIMPCNLCGSQETLQRKAIKAMLMEWERKTPGRVDNVFRALTDVRPSQLADRSLFDFAGLGARAEVSPDASDWLAGEPADTHKPFPVALVAAD